MYAAEMRIKTCSTSMKYLFTTAPTFSGSFQQLIPISSKIFQFTKVRFRLNTEGGFLQYLMSKHEKDRSPPSKFIDTELVTALLVVPRVYFITESPAGVESLVV